MPLSTMAALAALRSVEYVEIRANLPDQRQVRAVCADRAPRGIGWSVALVPLRRVGVKLGLKNDGRGSRGGRWQGGAFRLRLAMIRYRAAAVVRNAETFVCVGRVQRH